jgi:surface protein
VVPLLTTIFSALLSLPVQVFQDTSLFNQDVSFWDVSSVTSMVESK